MPDIPIRLRKPVKPGTERQLTPSECRFIRERGTSVQPYPGRPWTIVRSKAGSLGLWWRCADGTGGFWHLAEITEETTA